MEELFNEDMTLHMNQCCFTQECDLYRRDGYYNLPTYLMQWDDEVHKDETHHLFAIRLPGATRGCLWLDKKTRLITKIEFDYETSFGSRIGCYRRDIVDMAEKWIGKELV